MLEVALIVVVGLYCQFICRQNKKHWKVLQEYNKNIKAQEKRRQRQEKLKLVRVKHPKVVYLDDFRTAYSPQKVI